MIVSLILTVFSATIVLAQNSQFAGWWAYFDPSDKEDYWTLENAQSMCDEFNDSGFAYNGIEFISDKSLRSYIGMNDYVSCEISKIQRLRNTKVDIVDMDCDYNGNDKYKTRQLWMFETKEILIKAFNSNNNKDMTSLIHFKLCRKD